MRHSPRSVGSEDDRGSSTDLPDVFSDDVTGRFDPIECFHWLSDSEETVCFLKALFSWRCNRRRNKKEGRTPGIKYKSSLETFWKWWYLVYKAELEHGLNKDMIIKILDVLAIVA
ncbi:hypothetical protein BDV06DRAFT_229534 [Aspergillus oleicola]